MLTVFTMTAGMTQSATIAKPGESGPVERMRSGDRTAFSTLVKVHQQRIIAYCLRFLGERELAEDAAQEVFLTAWKERRRYRDQGTFDRYLLTIARNRCLALHKKRRSGWALATRYADLRATVQRADEFEPMVILELETALAKLSLKHRDLIVLRYLEGLSLDEIGEVTGLRAGTIKSRLNRGVASLRKELANDQ